MEASNKGLVLTRKEGQSVIIGEGIRITVYSPVRVKLGISAPRNVKVLREELIGKEPRNDRRQVQ